MLNKPDPPPKILYAAPATRFYLRFQGDAVPVPPYPVQGVVPWSGTQPLMVWYQPSAGIETPLLRAPCRSFVARAAAANVNPRTRLSHITPLSSVIGSPPNDAV